jgi:uncharacterized protein YjiS (DUF1127 family)
MTYQVAIHTARSPGAFARTEQAIRSIVDLIRVWHERARQRQMLASLDARMLQDIGLTRADVWRATNKPFWRA